MSILLDNALSKKLIIVPSILLTPFVRDVNLDLLFLWMLLNARPINTFPVNAMRDSLFQHLFVLFVKPGINLKMGLVLKMPMQPLRMDVLMRVMIRSVSYVFLDGVWVLMENVPTIFLLLQKQRVQLLE
jgi:hypothetical protein